MLIVFRRQGGFSWSLSIYHALLAAGIAILYANDLIGVGAALCLPGFVTVVAVLAGCFDESHSLLAEPLSLYVSLGYLAYVALGAFPLAFLCALTYPVSTYIRRREHIVAAGQDLVKDRFFARSSFNVEDLPPAAVRSKQQSTRPTVYACYPHGVLPLAAIYMMHADRDVTSGRICLPRLAVSRTYFRLPLINILSAGLGLVPASPEEMDRVLQQGHRRLIIAPEGHKGLLAEDSRRPQLEMYIGPEKYRHGFLKVAARNQAVVVPVFAPGTRDHLQVYWPWHALASLADRLLGFPFPCVVLLHSVPAAAPMRLVCGQPVTTAGRTGDDAAIFRDFHTELARTMRYGCDLVSLAVGPSVRAFFKAYPTS